MLRALTDRLRVAGDRLLSSSAADRVRPLKLLREVLGTANDLAGRPFCPPEELARRRARAARSSTGAAPARREPAPVMLYFDGQDHRTLAKMEELLRAREIPYRVLDVADDEATRSWALTAAGRHGGEREFPLLFIAGEPVGGLPAATQLDVNGTLVKRVFG